MSQNLCIKLTKASNVLLTKFLSHGDYVANGSPWPLEAQAVVMTWTFMQMEEAGKYLPDTSVRSALDDNWEHTHSAGGQVSGRGGVAPRAGGC